MIDMAPVFPVSPTIKANANDRIQEKSVIFLHAVGGLLKEDEPRRSRVPLRLARNTRCNCMPPS